MSKHRLATAPGYDPRYPRCICGEAWAFGASNCMRTLALDPAAPTPSEEAQQPEERHMETTRRQRYQDELLSLRTAGEATARVMADAIALRVISRECEIEALRAEVEDLRADAVEVIHEAVPHVDAPADSYSAVRMAASELFRLRADVEKLTKEVGVQYSNYLAERKQRDDALAEVERLKQERGEWKEDARRYAIARNAARDLNREAAEVLADAKEWLARHSGECNSPVCRRRIGVVASIDALLPRLLGKEVKR
jgi:hypothetical protein